jgi:hypothetical protein
MAWDHAHTIVLPFRLGHRVPHRWTVKSTQLATASQPLCRLYKEVDSSSSNSYMSLTTLRA